jgi:uncharacterized protein (DUF1810 family)
MVYAHSLERFLEAQDPLIEQVRAELRAGEKRTHWMWFVFPQLAGLGRSEIARYYAIGSRDEARAYLAHPVLGPRLIECAALVNGVEGKTAHRIFGSPDDLKFHSSMTLFAAANPAEKEFLRALRTYFGGGLDPSTVERLAGG